MQKQYANVGIKLHGTPTHTSNMYQSDETTSQINHRQRGHNQTALYNSLERLNININSN